ncbi:MAG: metallophosphatase domain-containing protein [Bacteroidota bacterium]
MRFVCFSDTHGRHERVSVPEGDVLVFAGDACERGTLDELVRFLDWFGGQPHPHKVLVAGNHDWPLDPSRPESEEARARVEAAGAVYLQDEALVLGGVKVYGSPWQPAFHDWAFNLPRGGPDLAHAWAQIPDDTDLLVTHGPPHGILDRNFMWKVCGCELLTARVAEVRPRVHVFGHIHEAAGLLAADDRSQSVPTTFANVSAVNLFYRPVHAPRVFDL